MFETILAWLAASPINLLMVFAIPAALLVLAVVLFGRENVWNGIAWVANKIAGRGVPVVLACLVLVPLGACVNSEQRTAMRDAALSSIASFNIAGVDPLQLSPDRLAILMAACSAAHVFTASIDDDIAPAVGDYCAVAVKAAGKGAQ